MYTGNKIITLGKWDLGQSTMFNGDGEGKMELNP